MNGPPSVRRSCGDPWALGWLLAAAAVLVAGGWARFAALDRRPMHADEATQGWIMARAAGPDGYRFSARHFHGPLLIDLTAPLARARGEHGFADYRPTTLRLVTAAAGLATLVALLACGRMLGWRAVLPGAMLAAASPLLVFFARDWIHETLLGLLAVLMLLALMAFCARPDGWRAALAGTVAGLLLATKETFALTFFVWALAGAIIAIEMWGTRAPAAAGAWVRPRWGHLAAAGVVAVLVGGWLLSDGGRYPGALWDAVRTYWMYETDPGHRGPWGYYGGVLLWPKRFGPLWLTELAILAWAATGWWQARRHPHRPRPADRSAGSDRSGRSDRSDRSDRSAGSDRSDRSAGSDRSAITRRWVRFLCYGGLGGLLLYSAIPYKTPWLAVVPWLQLCLAAGYGVAALLGPGRPLPLRLAALALFGASVAHLAFQTDWLAFRFHSDRRNPYTYSPTATDAPRMAELLAAVARANPGFTAGPVAVIGEHYWPLPWYLREFARIGYWPTMTPAAGGFPLVVAMPEQAAAATRQLGDNYFCMIRGLRHEVPVSVFVRMDCWRRFSAGLEAGSAGAGGARTSGSEDAR